MKEKKEDRRIQYTKMVMKNSLVELMKEKPISAITITELCKIADVNRNTFYKHYKTPRDVLNSIEKEIYDGLTLVLNPNSDVQDILEQICAILIKNKELCKVLVSPNGDFEFMKFLFEKVREYSIEDFKLRGINLEDKVARIAFEFNFFGGIAVIRSWAESDMKEDPHQIVQLIMKLGSGGLLSISQKNR